jgi:O-antigen/teichoic acid export membrane protein
MSDSLTTGEAARIDGVPHIAPPAADLQRRSEEAGGFSCPQPADSKAAKMPARGRVLRGSFVTIAGYGLGQVIRLAGNILVSRLVLPEAFGIMALVNILIQGLAMFSDVGIEPAVVQHRRGDEPRFYNTSWTIQVIRGFALLVVAGLLAWPASLVYDEPRLLALLPAAALASVVAGFNSTAIFAARRHILLGRLTALELGSQCAGVAVMCLWAATISAGAWAMIAGLFATVTVNLVGSHFLIAGYHNRFAWDKEAAAALFRFGRWVLLSTMITFCAMQVDRLLLGRLITKEMLGIYSVALAVAMLPNMLLQTLGGAVVYPLMARLARRAHSELCEKLSIAREGLSALGIFFVAGVVLEADTFFRLLYDDRYQAAGRIAQLLAVTVWISALATTLERVPQALGETRVLAVYNFIKLCAAALCSLCGFYYFGGLEGFILGYAVGIAVGHFALSWLLRQFGIRAWRDDLRATVLLIVVVAGGLGLRAAVAGLSHSESSRIVATEIASWAYLAGVGLWAAGKAKGLARLESA